MAKRGRLYKRGDTWWCWFYDHRGRRIRKSTHQRDRALAATAAGRIERDTLTAPATGPTLEDAVSAFLAEVERRDRAEMTLTYYTKKSVPLLRMLGDRLIAAIAPGDVTRYIDARRLQGAGKATTAKELGLMRSAMLHAGMASTAVRPLVGVHMRGSYTPRDRHLSRAEFKRLWLALSAERRDYLTTYCHLGVRESELYRLEAADLRGDMAHVRGKKTSRADRWIPLTPVVRAVLVRRARTRSELFPHWRNARRDLAAACKRAGIASVSHNDLRRTFASWLCERGTPELVTASLLGHASSAMVRRVYARIGQQAQRAAIRGLAVSAGVTDGARRGGKRGHSGSRRQAEKARK